MGGMPSARGLEWKGSGESRRKFEEGAKGTFLDKKPWYELRDEKEQKKIDGSDE